MQENALYQLRFLTVVIFMLCLSSCAFLEDFTKDSTETLQNTSEVSTDATSSTSHRDADKNKQSDAQKIKTFAAVNLDRLKEDMARGSGEHLTAFAQLLGIKPSHQNDFFAVTKQNYPVLFSTEPTTSEDLLARLDTELNAYPTWRQ